LGPLDQSAATEFFRTYVLSGWSAEQAMAALTATKLVKETRELIGSIADQARLADIRLNTPVLRVAQTDGEVRVELANGDSISAPVGLIALPMNVLNSVEFEPPLSEIKRTASDQRHAGAGMKCFVRVKGDIGNVSVIAPEANALNWAVTYRHGAEGSWLIAFASNPSKLPMTRFDDMAGLQDALQTLLPGVEVEQIVGWDWVNDPLALGTWCIYRPGQLAQILPEPHTQKAGCSPVPTRRPHGDPSSMELIESGYRAARDIDSYLTAGNH
jgi:monoamine oxidase